MFRTPTNGGKENHAFSPRHKIAATLGVIGILAGTAGSAMATNGTQVCHREGNGSSHTINVNNNSVLQAHLRHGDTLGPCATPTPTGTATPTSTPSVTPTPVVEPTLFPAAVEDGDNDPCKNHPFLNAHNQVRVIIPNVWMQDTDCGQYIIEVQRPAPATPKGEAPAAPVVPQPTFTFGNYPQPDFDISQITALPKAGDGSLSD